MTACRIETKRADQSSTLVLRGEIDLAVADEIVERGRVCLTSESTSSLTIDLGDVTFIDSTALGALIQLRNIALAANKGLELSRVPARVSRVLAIAGLTAVFDTRRDGLDEQSDER